ncbi:helix-turn-helix domain-containing protein [Streptomyces peucetius]|uniref:Helix-turn-helix domain-containing protein n=1 Tax=Streptomyces peucetius TaxID=1950 RepID=A0ABY6IG97_STRPE|nr:helix-turn-helix domain-containing protein [Streptomyces peucetius]
MMLLASAGGNTALVIANLVQADEDTVRDLIHRFNEIGLACLDPQWAGGRPRLLTPDDEEFVIQTATSRPTKLGKPFTRWSIRKLADHLRRNVARPIRIGREALRCLLHRRGVTFQRTKTWEESSDPDFDAKLDRIEYALAERPDRTLAFDEFGPLGIRPTAGACWAEKGRPDRLAATFHRTHGVTYFHGCYSVGNDTLWGVNRRRKGITPTNASWANPIEAHFGPLRQFTLANSNHPNHTVHTQELHRYLRWRNQNTRHPDVLAAQRRERARVRSDKGIRWGGRPLKAAA